MPPGFSVAVEASDGRDVVRVTGELDMATVDVLSDATRGLIRAGRTVEFDLTGLSFIDSTGLKYFIQARRVAERDGFAFTVRRPPPIVFRTFQLTSLDGLFSWVE